MCYTYKSKNLEKNISWSINTVYKNKNIYILKTDYDSL